jgi:hypothetical protein
VDDTLVLPEEVAYPLDAEWVLQAKAVPTKVQDGEGIVLERPLHESHSAVKRQFLQAVVARHVLLQVLTHLARVEVLAQVKLLQGGVARQRTQQLDHVLVAQLIVLQVQYLILVSFIITLVQMASMPNCPTLFCCTSIDQPFVEMRPKSWGT